MKIRGKEFTKECFGVSDYGIAGKEARTADKGS
jgi:hypothetical protein